MTATNHTLTGALIVSVIPNPVAAIILAFFAHFALDALPHYGAKDTTSPKFLYFLAADMGLAAAILLSIFLLQPPNWQLLILGGIACASPDLMWVRYLLHELKGKKLKLGPIARLHSKIQWGESTKGIVIELVWFVVVGAIFANTLVA